MTQTTDAMSWEDAYVEVAVTTNSTFYDISGSTNTVDATGGDVATATAYTHGTFEPLVGYGPAALVEVNVNALYTEVSGEAFDRIRTAYKNRSDVWLRWTPKGNVGSVKRYVTTTGRITKFKDPSGEAGTANFVVMPFTVTAPKINQDTT